MPIVRDDSAFNSLPELPTQQSSSGNGLSKTDRANAANQVATLAFAVYRPPD
jgi:hypothetical protein